MKVTSYNSHRLVPPASPHVGGHPGDEADLEDVVVVRREGELALVCLLPVDKVLALRVHNHHVNLG